MSDTAFMPAWAWAIAGLVVVGGAILIALPEPAPRPRHRGYRGLRQRRRRG